MDLKKLINDAAAIVGTRYKLAQALHVQPGAVYSWETGAKPCPPADIALMASIAGYDPTTWLARATIEKYEGTPKGDQLARALAKPWAATGGGTASNGPGARRTYSAPEIRRSIEVLTSADTTPTTARWFFFAHRVPPRREKTSRRRGCRQRLRWYQQTRQARINPRAWRMGQRTDRGTQQGGDFPRQNGYSDSRKLHLPQTP
jgi:hypothetical protein